MIRTRSTISVNNLRLSIGVIGDAGFRAHLTDGLQNTMDVRAGFVVHCHDIRPSLDETLNMLFRLNDHQMDVQRQRGRSFAGSDNIRPKSDIRHKATIHDINVDKIRTTLFTGSQVSSQIVQISGKDRR
jgi:hypothetical protein